MYKVKITNTNNWYKEGEIYTVIEETLEKEEYRASWVLLNNRECQIEYFDCEVIREPTDVETLEFFYNEYLAFCDNKQTKQARALRVIINKINK